MIITLPFNSEYLKNKYKMQDSDIKRLTKEALPMLVEKLSMDSRVDGIEIFSDIGFGLELGLSSKIKIIRSNTEGMTRPEDVILNYITTAHCKQEVIVIYNPLFPFVSIKKIDFLFQRVSSGFANSGIGSYFDAQGLCDENMAKSSDRGIFSVINKTEFLRKSSRLISPADTVSLSALELVSLRSKEDYELYGLIVNSGLNQ
jgi:hypothetical protein